MEFKKGQIDECNISQIIFLFVNKLQLCGSAISQIIRKASGSKREHCLEILFEATENADDSNSLLEMTGNIDWKVKMKWNLI